MYRTRFIFGVSVLFLAAGVTACKGLGDSQKPAQTTTPPKATASPTRKTTKPPAKTSAPSANAQHTAPSAARKAQTPSVQPAKTASAAAAKTPPPPQANSTVADKTNAAPKTTIKPTDRPQATAKAAAKPVIPAKAADTKLAKAEKPKTIPTPASMPTKAEAGTTTATQLTPVQEKLKQNTNLSAKIGSRLPAGTDVVKAADGFSNLGQFVAAVNASSNLQLSFADLKSKLVDGKMSLAQAIQAVRPLTASPTIEAQRAEYDARGVIAESEQQPSQTTTPGATTVANKSAAPSTTTTSKQKGSAKKPAQ
jgi:hypothetical protein